MQTWTTFLEQQGARAIDPQTGAIGSFASAANAVPATDFMTPLTGFGLIEASGEEAAHFLHNQLTNDVERLDTASVRLAGYCTPKGRLLATFLLWKTPESIYLQLPRALQPAIQKRLQMYILRAKAKLADAGERLAQLGLAGTAATAALARWFPAMPAAPYSRVDSEAGSLLRLADVPAATTDGAAIARYLWIAPPATLEAAWPALQASLVPSGEAAWQWTDIRAAVPTITPATQDQFVPQMINYEAIGGVNFKKGCYPGQEIVARSQYLGKLKRRMLPATIAGNLAGSTADDSAIPAADTIAVAPGMELFSEADPSQACGMIVNAAPAGPGQIACLAEIKLAAADSVVHLGAVDGPVLQFLPLPYALADADTPALR